LGTFIKLLKGAVPLSRYPYVGEQIDCALCGSDQKQTLCEYDRRIKKLTTVICMNCGLLRTDPMPTDDELSDYYRLSYRFDYQLAGTRPPAFHLKRSMDNAVKRMQRLAPVVKTGARFLDFGSGSGELLKVARDAGCEATGIEPGQAYATFATQTYGVEVFNDAWQNVDLGDRKFDLITSFHVFEHLRDPLAAMGWLADHLAGDGTITICRAKHAARRQRAALVLNAFTSRMCMVSRQKRWRFWARPAVWNPTRGSSPREPTSYFDTQKNHGFSSLTGTGRNPCPKAMTTPTYWATCWGWAGSEMR